eukprot:COSAG06_NODE_3003_length_5970_cov_3.618123_3_plen_112_part_00
MAAAPSAAGICQNEKNEDSDKAEFRHLPPICLLGTSIRVCEKAEGARDRAPESVPLKSLRRGRLRKTESANTILTCVANLPHNGAASSRRRLLSLSLTAVRLRQLARLLTT